MVWWWVSRMRGRKGTSPFKIAVSGAKNLQKKQSISQDLVREVNNH